MSSYCQVSGKKPIRGVRYKRKGLAKAKGGVGVKIVGKTKRWFRPNLQRVKVIEKDGTVRRLWVTTAVIKAGLITKAPKQKIAWQVRKDLAEAKKK